MNKKRVALISVIVGAVVLAAAGVGIAAGVAQAGTIFKPEATYGYDCYISSSVFDVEAKYKVKFRYADFFGNGLYIYSKNTASLAYAESLDVFNGAIARKSELKVTDEKDNTQFLKSLGFNRVMECNVTNDEIDTYDNTRLVIGTANGGTKSNLVLVAFDVTSSSTDWNSNLDIGANTTDYAENMSAEHPDWTNYDNHKGFDVTATRALVQIKSYIETFSNSTMYENVTVCFVGYSRGGAIANLCAAKFIDYCNSVRKDTNNPFRNCAGMAYTFGTPTTTCSNKVGDQVYKTIFNHVNEDDANTQLPPTGLGFKRYGQDITLSLKNNTSGKNKFKELTGLNYYTGKRLGAFMDLLNSTFHSREDVYKLDKNDESMKVSFKSTHKEDGLEEKYYAYKSTFEELGAEDCVYLSDFNVVKDIHHYKEDDFGTVLEDYWEYEANFYFVYSLEFIIKLAPIVIVRIQEGAPLLELYGYLNYLNCPKFSPLKSALTYCFMEDPQALFKCHHAVTYYIELFTYWDRANEL